MAGKFTRLKTWLLHNIEIKVMALTLAMVTWYSVRDTLSFELVVRDIKLDPQLKEGMAILDQSASSVDVTFRGSLDDIQRLDAKRIRAVVDLRQPAIPTTELVTIKANEIEGARGATPVHINPQRIRFALDREEVKRLPVKVRIVGRPEAPYEVETATCEPASVLLRGPARRLQLTDLLYTQPLDVDGSMSSLSRRVPVMPPSDRWIAHIEPLDVQVHVTVAEKVLKQEYQDVPVAVVADPLIPRRATVQPTRVNVTVNGPSAEVQSLDARALKVFVDCIGLPAAGSYDLPVQVYWPKRTGLTLTADPAVAHVTIENR